MADLGSFLVETDTGLANSLPAEQAALYECLLCSGQDISAYLVDGDFSFAASARRDRQPAQAAQVGTATHSSILHGLQCWLLPAGTVLAAGQAAAHLQVFPAVPSIWKPACCSCA